MKFRPLERAKFAIERSLVRGPFHRVALAALPTLFISPFGGLLVYLGGHGCEGLPDAVWWSFLWLPGWRSSKPGSCPWSGG